MDIELIAKFLTIPGVIKSLHNAFTTSNKSNLREEYKFAQEFMADLKPGTHALVIEKGYCAVTGDSTLSAKEITYLLSLPSPHQAIDKYAVAHKYLEFKEYGESKAKIIFREKYTASKLKSVRWCNTIAYIFFAVLAFVPLIFAPKIFGSNLQLSLIVIPFLFVAFGSLAYLPLDELSRIRRSEELVNMQKST